mmetsp:Transcript_13825/g.27563  ORF Transcript_13825/g.27563 Transcript_13825/m.27563 type:complete len:237 (-) Transcript_13825:277-987(-)
MNISLCGSNMVEKSSSMSATSPSASTSDIHATSAVELDATISGEDANTGLETVSATIPAAARAEACLSRSRRSWFICCCCSGDARRTWGGGGAGAERLNPVSIPRAVGAEAAAAGGWERRSPREAARRPAKEVERERGGGMQRDREKPGVGVGAEVDWAGGGSMGTSGLDGQAGRSTARGEGVLFASVGAAGGVSETPLSLSRRVLASIGDMPPFCLDLFICTQRSCLSLWKRSCR